jgi:small subunit ribosomal protein S8
MITDPIADLLTRIRNASLASHSWVNIPFSILKHEILKVLFREGFIGEIKIIRNYKFPILKVYLIFDNKNITLKRKSSPGNRTYVRYRSLRKVKNGYGLGLISSSLGILTVEEAIEKKIGGEYICEVY